MNGSNSLDSFLEEILAPEASSLIESEGETVKDDLLEATANTQYTTFAGCYMPTTSTIQTLPPGTYKPYMAESRLLFKPTKIFTDKLIEFPDTVIDDVLKQIDLFWTKKAKFQQLGFSHKRGILLAGPPAGGKSSLIAISMQKMVKSGNLVLIAEHPGLIALALQQLREVEPERPVVIIWEDLDAVVKRYGESEVLAVLDGESQVSNVMFIATTNFPEDLEQRITNRPSRFDRIEVIGMPSAAARRLYLEAKVGKTEHDGVDLVKETDGLSIAHLRELIVSVWCLDLPVKETLNRLRKMAKPPTSGNWNNSKTGF